MKYLPEGSQAESLYELAWNHAQDSTFAVDTETGIIVDVNPAAESLTGYTRSRLIGMPFTALHPQAEHEQLKSGFARIGLEPFSVSGLHVQRKNGALVPVLIWSSVALRHNGRPVAIGEFRYITEFQQQEHRLRTKRWALAAYAGAALALGREASVESLLKSICDAITRESVYVLAWVAMADDNSREIQVAAASGSASNYLRGLSLTWDRENQRRAGPVGTCMRTRELQLLQDTETAPAFAPWLELARQEGIRSVLSVPLALKGSRRGALNVYASRPHAFEPVAIEVFQHLAEQIGHGIHTFEQGRTLSAEHLQLVKMQSQLTEALSAMVAPIVLAMEMRDPYTTGHQARVAEIAVAIGRELGWAEERLQGLRVAAQVHDIGKISIPSEILTKPGNLSPVERAMINQHAETGYAILKDIPFPWPIGEIVRQHHEKLDGSGYPRRLKGDEILPEARVLAVADVVEAMAAYRPYRPGVKLSVVLQRIEREAGVALDSEAVRICAHLFRKKQLVIPRSVPTSAPVTPSAVPRR